jgi:hypothetical protein
MWAMKTTEGGHAKFCWVWQDKLLENVVLQILVGIKSAAICELIFKHEALSRRLYLGGCRKEAWKDSLAQSLVSHPLTPQQGLWKADSAGCPALPPRSLPPPSLQLLACQTRIRQTLLSSLNKSSQAKYSQERNVCRVICAS